MITELITALRESTYERIKNPFLGALAVVLMATNWRPLYVAIFADIPIAERMKLIESYTKPWYEAVGLPAAIALAYVIAMPWIAYGIQLAMARPTSLRKKHKLDSDLTILQLRKRIVQAEIDNESLREQATLQIETNRKNLEFNIREREWNMEEMRLQAQQNHELSQTRIALKAAEDFKRQAEEDLRRLRREAETHAASMANSQHQCARAEEQRATAYQQIQDLKDDNLRLRNKLDQMPTALANSR